MLEKMGSSTKSKIYLSVVPTIAVTQLIDKSDKKIEAEKKIAAAEKLKKIRKFWCKRKIKRAA